MNEITVEELILELKRGSRVIFQVRHAERPKMDPDDPTFGDALKLTAEGCRTARILGEKLADFREEVEFFSSPLTRTRMTAELIAEGMGVKPPVVIPTDERLGNSSFYYDDPSAVLEVFQPKNFFRACFDYFRTGEQRGFKNLHAATDEFEHWLEAHFTRKLMVVATHDCYVAAFLAARGAYTEFSKETWIRFLDGGAIVYRPDGEKRYFIVRSNLSEGICGVA